MHEDCTSSVTDKNKRRISGCAVASRWRWHPLIDQPRVMPVPPDPNADVEVAGGGDVDYADIRLLLPFRPLVRVFQILSLIHI